MYYCISIVEQRAEGLLTRRIVDLRIIIIAQVALSSFNSKICERNEMSDEWEVLQVAEPAAVAGCRRAVVPVLHRHAPRQGEQAQLRRRRGKRRQIQNCTECSVMFETTG